MRFPFFDVRVVKLCLSFPGDQKLRNGLPRFVMRNAMAGIVPDAVCWRPNKSMLGHGFQHALRSHGRKTVESVLPNLDAISHYVDPMWCRELVAPLMAGTARPGDVTRFFLIIALALWLARSHRASTACTSTRQSPFGATGLLSPAAG
jgi:asparagine synthase (glutamine-hydrolysing)